MPLPGLFLCTTMRFSMRSVNTAAIDVSRTPVDLAEVVASIATRPADWIDRVRFRVGQRWYERLSLEADYDVWVITWLPGQATGFHDHGASSGAFAVASGVLEEERADQGTRLMSTGDVRTFGPTYAHDVRNRSTAPAISIHAYSPPLTTMTHYERDGGELVPVASSQASNEDGSVSSGIGRLLAAARSRLRRVTAVEARAAVAEDAAVLVDIRPAAQRAAEG